MALNFVSSSPVQETTIFEQFMSLADAGRATKAMQKLWQHRTDKWVLTGGFAVEIHISLLGLAPSTRALNDMDFIVTSFGCIPESLNREYLCRHIHPFDPPGKTLAQFIDVDSKLRIDVFRAYGSTLSRALPVRLPCGTAQVISVEDLTARLARVALQLAEGTPVAAKYARDLVRLFEVVGCKDVEPAWLDHRLAKHPIKFRDACNLAMELIASRPRLLVNPEYSKNTSERCGRCVADGRFRLVDPARMLAIMGYC